MIWTLLHDHGRPTLLRLRGLRIEASNSSGVDSQPLLRQPAMMARMQVAVLRLQRLRNRPLSKAPAAPDG